MGYGLVHARSAAGVRVGPRRVVILGACELSEPHPRTMLPMTPHDRLGAVQAGHSSARKRATCWPRVRATIGLGSGQRLGQHFLDRVAGMDTPDLQRESEPVDSADHSAPDLGEGPRPPRRGNRGPQSGDRAVSPGRLEDDGPSRRCVVPPTDAVAYGVKQSAALDASSGTSGKVDVVVPPGPPQLTPGAARALLRILLKAAGDQAQ